MRHAAKSILRMLTYVSLICRLFVILVFAAATTRLAAQDVTFTIDAVNGGRAIPPDIYGANELGFAGATVNRHGGNRHTGLNWENNASNAGSDYFHHSDSYLGSNAGIGNSQVAGALLEAWVNADRAQNLETVLTLPLAGYVAADVNGTVTVAETAPSARWKQVVVNKGAPLSLTPDKNDGSVFLDEMVNFVVTKFGTSAEGGVAGYSLDNEPALWSETHPRIHPNHARYDEVAAKHAAAAAMVTSLDATAQIYGPALYGWGAHLNLQNAPDSGAHNPTFGTFTGYYLAQMKSASGAAGRRLLHRYDLHWYPEARGDNRIVFGSGPGTNNDIDARLQAPRSLWDAAYVETSWITEHTTNGQGIRLLPRLQEIVDARFPGTGLALMEYNYGGTDHISGGVAQADVLGILGRYAAAACFWPLGGADNYVRAAFNLYRNYDGAGSTFGNVSLGASASDNARAGVHAARATDDKLTVVVTNRSRTQAQNASFQFTLPNGQSLTAVKAYRLTAEGGAQVQPVGSAPPISGSSFTDTLAAMSATLYEVQVSATSNGAAQLGNISTRANVGTADNVLIGGFIITGSEPKRVIVRAIGPSLPIVGALGDPTLQFLNDDGVVIAQNDNWREPGNEIEVESTGIPPSHDDESAVVRTLEPGAYTAVVRGVGDTTGVALVEAYDLSGGAVSKLANIATRGFVGAGNNVLIGGLIVVGDASAKVVVRAIGPSLPVGGALADPTLALYDANGVELRANDNWRQTQQAEITAAQLAPTNDLESAMIHTVQPGNYTAIVRGRSDTTGIGLVEVYNIE